MKKSELTDALMAHAEHAPWWKPLELQNDMAMDVEPGFSCTFDIWLWAQWPMTALNTWSIAWFRWRFDVYAWGWRMARFGTTSEKFLACFWIGEFLRRFYDLATA